MTGKLPALRIGTRGSALALAQAALVARRVEGLDDGTATELVPIRTSGDARRDRPAAPAPGDKSRFVREIEEALLDGRVDLAVHSAKDLPGDLPDGLAVVGVPAREDAGDTLCGAGSLDELPEGAVVGTASLRRRAQLLAARPDLDVRDLRGNVDTRLRRLAGGDFSSLVLATAGLVRLGLLAPGGDRLEGPSAGSTPCAPVSPTVMTPAPGQGCLALEARADDARAAAIAEALTDRAALLRLTAERAVVSALDATCRTPVGAHALLSDTTLELATFVGLPNGGVWIRDALSGSADAPGELGRAAAERLLAAGAGDLLDEADRSGPAAASWTRAP